MKSRLKPYLVLATLALIFAIGYHFNAGKIGVWDTPEHNLLLNASLEEPFSDTLPRFWRPGGEGQRDAVFRYPVAGYQGGKAVYVELANRETGDAKWLPYDVAVVPGETYTFTSMYRANVASKIYARYNRGTCLTEAIDCEYEELGVKPAAKNWTQANVSFKVPVGVRSLTVFQLLDTDGWLSLSEPVLAPRKPAIATTQSHIPNATLAAGLANLETPAGWLESSQGDNQPIHEYISNDGVDDRSSIKVTVAGHQSGDAKWLYEPQAIAGGRDYLFSVAYKTDIVPDAGVQLINGAGEISYLRLPKPNPQGAEWQHYAHEFFAPQGTLFAAAFLTVATNGYLQTDDYRLTPFTHESFEQPIVTLTFDDGYPENIETALPIMTKHGFKATHCYTTGDLQKNSAKRQSLKTWHQAGHEICAHSVTHADLTKLGGDALINELKQSQAALEKLVGAPVPNFATPYGAYNPTVKDAIKQFYGVHRTINNGFNSPENLDRYALKTQNLYADTPLVQFKEWVDRAIADQTWLILTYHRIGTTESSAYTTPIADFTEQMAYLASTGVRVMTLDEAVEVVMGQIGE
ncbi:MAG: polysaccharide deacetylase family protein [Cyanobacteria bacterium P01_G01_bin.54]